MHVALYQTADQDEDETTHVVDHHHRGQNDLACSLLQQTLGHQHVGSDPDTGGDHRGADKNRISSARNHGLCTAAEFRFAEPDWAGPHNQSQSIVAIVRLGLIPVEFPG